MLLRWQARSVLVCACLGLLTLAITAWALTLGDYPLSPAQVWAALIGDPEAGFARTIVTQWRLAVMGAFMLAAADVIAQQLLPVVLPVGVVTVVGGGAFLVWLIVREVRRRD